MAEHVADRFARLPALYRKPDGSEWGGQNLETATGGAVTRSYVSSLRRGRIDSPSLEKMEALAEAMGFPPALWFGDGGTFAENLHAATLENPTAEAILGEVARLGQKEWELLLSLARAI